MTDMPGRKLVTREGDACWYYPDGSHRGLNQADCDLINRVISAPTSEARKAALDWFIKTKLTPKDIPWDVLCAVTEALQQPDHIRDVTKMVSGNDEQPDTSEAVGVLAKATERALIQFRQYEELHTAKGTSEGSEKALVNRRYADMLRQALDHPAVIAAMKGEDHG